MRTITHTIINSHIYNHTRTHTHKHVYTHTYTHPQHAIVAKVRAGALRRAESVAQGVTMSVTGAEAKNKEKVLGEIRRT